MNIDVNKVIEGYSSKLNAAIKDTIMLQALVQSKDEEIERLNLRIQELEPKTP